MTNADLLMFILEELGDTLVWSLLALIGTTTLLGALGISAGILALRGQWRALRYIAGAAVGAGTVYGGALGVVSMRSAETTLPPGAEKYICELDCHLAYRVERASEPDAAGRIRVTLAVRFDARTAGAARGDAPLRPRPRRILLLTGDGKHHAPLGGMHGWPALRPGEQARVRLDFRLPPGSVPERLLVTEAGPLTRVLIGHENSPGHAKTMLALHE